MVRGSWFAVGMLVLGCGGSRASHSAEAPAAQATLDVPRLVLQVASERAYFLQHASGTRDALEQAVRDAPGPDKVEPLCRLAVATLWEAEETLEARARRRLYQAAGRAARDAAGRTADPRVTAEMALVDLWIGWRTGRRTVGRSLERFIDTRHDSPEATLYAWVIRGEMALERRRYSAAASAYRFVLGQLDHPLYALALYRTAQCYRGLDRQSDARQALREASELGRRRGAHEAVRHVAAVARTELAAP